MNALREVFGQHHFARRVDMKFNPEMLMDALGRQKEEWWRAHEGPYHDGAWESISIWAPKGNLFEQRSVGGSYAKTIAALVSPYFWSVAEQFRCDRSRVRLMRLKAGGHIFRHSDPLKDIGPSLVRFHIPIVTNSDVQFMVNDQRVVMLPGEVWHVDVRFPHEVRNLGKEHRVHLVLDLFRNSFLESLLENAHSAGRDRLTMYYFRHSLPRPIRGLFRIAN